MLPQSCLQGCAWELASLDQHDAKLAWFVCWCSSMENACCFHTICAETTFYSDIQRDTAGFHGIKDDLSRGNFSLCQRRRRYQIQDASKARVMAIHVSIIHVTVGISQIAFDSLSLSLSLSLFPLSLSPLTLSLSLSFSATLPRMATRLGIDFPASPRPQRARVNISVGDP